MFKVMGKVAALKSHTTPKSRRWLKETLLRLGAEVRAAQVVAGNQDNVVAVDRAIDLLNELNVD